MTAVIRIDSADHGADIPATVDEIVAVLIALGWSNECTAPAAPSAKRPVAQWHRPDRRPAYRSPTSWC